VLGPAPPESVISALRDHDLRDPEHICGLLDLGTASNRIAQPVEAGVGNVRSNRPALIESITTGGSGN
jgi:hypothetical protein